MAVQKIEVVIQKKQVKCPFSFERFNARGRNGGIREELATGMKKKRRTSISPACPMAES
jgi:hypothetical protein